MKYKTFDQIISDLKLPRYYTPYKLVPSSFRLDEHVVPSFKKLFRPAGTKKNIGNGEVAVYWLLNRKYGGLYDIKKQEHGDTADLLIDNKQVEIKAWKHKLDVGTLTKIGRFEKQHEVRRIINVIFGAYNVFMAGYNNDKYGKKSYLSETRFGINGLTRAFDCALRIQHVNFNRLNNVREILSMKEYEGLKDPADFAAKTFAILATEKLLRKIGSYGFIINANPDSIGDIQILQLGDVNSVDLDIIKNGGARVMCSELFLDLLAFCKKDV